jgi:hypothetical protein
MSNAQVWVLIIGVGAFLIGFLVALIALIERRSSRRCSSAPANPRSAAAERGRG